MYYIEKEIVISRGVYSQKAVFHVITSYQVDFLAKEISLSIASYSSKTSFAKAFFNADSSQYATFNQVGGRYDKMNFSIDPCLFALRIACSDERSIFHGSEIKKIYDLSEFRDRFLYLPDELIGQTHPDYSSTPIDFTGERSENSSWVEPKWENDLTTEFTISDVNAGNVILPAE